MHFTLSTAVNSGQASNTIYPHQQTITNAQELEQAAHYDHVCGQFKNNQRAIANFIKADCLIMDCDNDHSDDPTTWINPANIANYFDDVSYAITLSRNNMKAKHHKAPRPKFHVYFPITEITDAKTYTELKHEIQEYFPYFDDNALDAARFAFGVPRTKAIWHDGSQNVDQFMVAQRYFEQQGVGAIHEGQRNATLSHFAGRIIMRLGNTDEARQAFQEEAAKCNPPLSKQELKNIWHSATKFGQRMASQKGYIPPEEYNQPNDDLQPDDYSDTGESYVFVNNCKERVCYTNQSGFMWFDGKVWQESEPLALGEVQRFTDKQLADAQLRVTQSYQAIQNNGVAKALQTMGKTKASRTFNDEQQAALKNYENAKAYEAFILKERSTRGINGILTNSRPKLVKEINDFDVDPFLLNTPNGPFNLKKGMHGQQKIQADELITKSTSCVPGNQGASLWQEALTTFFCGDQALINYVQEIVGLVAIGQVYLEALIIAYGSGRNGKSTFWNTIANVLGTYTGHLSADALTTGVRRNVKPEMAEVKGKRLIISAELEEGKRLNTSIVKQLCSTDEIYAEKKYMKPFSFTPSHTIVLYTNYLPHVGGNDEGIWRRLIVIPFKATIAKRNDVKNYAQFLTEKAGPAVLQWIIEGAQRIIQQNYRLTTPAAVEKAVNAYHADNDWLGHFLNENCELDPSYKQKSGDLYQKYREYCQGIGEYIRSTTDFYTALKNAGFQRQHKQNGRFIKGLRLKVEADEFLS
ncbi:phage/plasmid primase, P4 family [Limosilactobacillus fermentum]|uniref:phage/plasmid primase, P4 family n=1 Tax=Limosilactobacillus fermentum TaxID=1613 RepID=UPI0027BAB24F|nr:phage/plasmid primase, P4 family [Limosilactobacillus fermentum]WLW44120.1 phage/plasmid primase, P4 family [Limosilactobacillus fermentum]